MQWAKRNGSTEYAASKRKRIQIDVANAIEEFDQPMDGAGSSNQWSSQDVSTASSNTQRNWGSDPSEIVYNQSPSDQPRYSNLPGYQDDAERSSAWNYYSSDLTHKARPDWGNGSGYTDFGQAAQNTFDTGAQQGSQQYYGGAGYRPQAQVGAPRHNAPSTNFQSTMQAENRSVTLKQILPAILVAGILVLVTVLTLFS